MKKCLKLILTSVATLGLLSACANSNNNSPAATQSAVAAQTLVAAESAVPTATATSAATNTGVPTATLAPTNTETPLPTSTWTPTPQPTSKPLPYACVGDGVGMSHIEITNNSGQTVTVDISSNNCFKQVEVADSNVVTVTVPYAVYVVYGYIGTQTYFSVSGYVSDSIHTWFVKIRPDSAVMLGP